MTLHQDVLESLGNMPRRPTCAPISQDWKNATSEEKRHAVRERERSRCVDSRREDVGERS